MSRFRVELFGGFRLVVGDRVDERLDGRRSGALLAYLAYYPERPHARRSLIDVLWPDGDVTAARASLRQALAAIRRAAEEAGGDADTLVRATHGHIQLAPEVATDVRDFARARAAIEIATSTEERIAAIQRAVGYYAGELLPAFDEMWIMGERRRHVEAALGALQELTSLLEQAGDIEAALDYALRAVAADPWREESYLAVMRLYRTAGQHAAALRQYREMERVLNKQLGEEPSSDARVLVELIRTEANEYGIGGGNGFGGHNTPVPAKVSRVPWMSTAGEQDVPSPDPGVPVAGNGRRVARSVMTYGIAALLIADVVLRWNIARIRGLATPSYRTTFKPITFKGGLEPGVELRGRIVCQSAHGNLSDLVLIDTIRGTIQTLATGDPEILSPSWAPDGKQVLYVRSNHDHSFSICALDLARHQEQCIFTDASGLEWPRWSPDGRHIAFCWQTTGSWQVYTMNADGSDRVQLTHSSTRETQPAWSPDGNQIAYSSESPGFHQNAIFLMDATGSHPHRITTGTGCADIWPAWSPDGQRIAYIHAASEGSNVFVIGSRGNDPERLTHGPEDAESPAWACDGQSIVFTTNRTHNNEIWAIRSDGSHLQRITNTAAYESRPSVYAGPPD